MAMGVGNSMVNSGVLSPEFWAPMLGSWACLVCASVPGCPWPSLFYDMQWHGTLNLPLTLAITLPDLTGLHFQTSGFCIANDP